LGFVAEQALSLMLPALVAALVPVASALEIDSNNAPVMTSVLQEELLLVMAVHAS